MKKYLVISSLFLLAVTPAFAKNTVQTNSQPAQTNNSQNSAQNKNTVTPKSSITPTGQQVKNQNQAQTQNQGDEQQLSVKNQEAEQLNQNIDDSFQKVSDQVHQLIDTLGAKTGIGPQVKEIAQNQTKLQDNIKINLSQLSSRSALSKFFVGSDKKLIQNMNQQMEQNRLMIQQFEELKLQIKNSADLQQLQETIDLMTYQNTSLEEKINLENKAKGLFGWFINLFRK